MSDIIFVLAVYNNENEVVSFVEEQLLKQTFENLRIYLVLNAFKKAIVITDNRVIILNPGKNLGYLGALRYVIEQHNPVFDYITLCNTDLDLGSTRFLKTYIEAIDQQKFSLAAPLIRSSLTQGSQNPLYINRLSHKKIRFLRYLYKHYLLFILYQSLFYIKKRLGRSQPYARGVAPYALHGSFITLSNTYFEKGGSINYPIFLYGEELFFAEEARRIKLQNFICNDIEIKHNEHSTTGIFKSRKQLKYLKDSVDYIYNTYYAGK